LGGLIPVLFADENDANRFIGIEDGDLSVLEEMDRIPGEIPDLF